jgi:hypothetical protein
LRCLRVMLLQRGQVGLQHIQEAEQRYVNEEEESRPAFCDTEHDTHTAGSCCMRDGVKCIPSAPNVP